MKNPFRKIVLFGSFFVTVVLLTGRVGELSTAPVAPKPLTVYFLSVGHGDANLIVTPGGKCILIDGGSGSRKSGAGKSVILPFLSRLGIRRIDTIVITHADGDHIGGLLYILKSPIDIRECLDPGFPHTTELYQEVLDAVQARRSIKYRQPRAGESLDWGKGLKVRVVNPKKLYSTTNDSSLVIQLVYGDVSFLFTGDAGARAEKDMVAAYGSGLRSKILKVGHHGSRYSSSEIFINAVHPEVAMISCSKDDPTHPHPEIVNRLKQHGVSIYRTDRDGIITVTTDGKKYEVTTEKTTGPHIKNNGPNNDRRLESPSRWESMKTTLKKLIPLSR